MQVGFVKVAHSWVELEWLKLGTLLYSNGEGSAQVETSWWNNTKISSLLSKNIFVIFNKGYDGGRQPDGARTTLCEVKTSVACHRQFASHLTGKRQFGEIKVLVTLRLLGYIWVWQDVSWLATYHVFGVLIFPSSPITFESFFKVLSTLKLPTLSLCVTLFLLLKFWKRFSIETGGAAISQGSVSAFLPMQHCTKENRLFPVKRSRKREFPFQDNLLWWKTEFPKFWHYRQFYRTSCRGRIKWSQNSIKRLDCKKEIGLFWKGHGKMSHPQSKLLHGAAYNGWNRRRGGRKCVLGKAHH